MASTIPLNNSSYEEHSKAKAQDPEPSTGEQKPDKEQDGPALSHAFKWECEVSFQGGRDLKELFDKCTKNPTHGDFIPVREFLDPEKGLCDPEKLDFMKRISDRTVKVTSFLVSRERPDVFKGTSTPYPYSHLKGKDALRCGTGLIVFVELIQAPDDPCKCIECKESPQPKTEYYEIHVHTACHVVYNEEEAQDSVFELFYDSEDDKTGVRKFRGISAWSRPSFDLCTIRCHTHDKHLVDRFDFDSNRLDNKILFYDLESPLPGWIISHPHGRCKHVSQGTLHLGGNTWRGSLPNLDTALYRLPRRSFLSRIIKRNNNNKNNNLQRSLLSRIFKHNHNNDNPGEWIPHNDFSWFNEDYKYYELPRGTKWILPEGCHQVVSQRIVARRQQCGDDDPVNVDCIKAPAGTLIALPGGERVPLPKEAEIDMVRPLFDHLFYDISTCPGSSGAPILNQDNDGKIWVSYGLCHAGAEEDANRSSLDSITLI